jgi:uncharacterized protein
MENLAYVLAMIAAIIGAAGSFLPILPGPPLAWGAMLLLYFYPGSTFSTQTLLLHSIIVAGITVLDYFIPIWGTKRFGGTKAGERGSMIGLLLGLFAPPIGIIVGPFLGAFIGELVQGSSRNQAFRSAIGSFLGFLAGVFLKLVYCLYVIWLIIEVWLK